MYTQYIVHIHITQYHNCFISVVSTWTELHRATCSSPNEKQSLRHTLDHILMVSCTGMANIQYIVTTVHRFKYLLWMLIKMCKKKNPKKRKLALRLKRHF